LCHELAFDSLVAFWFWWRAAGQVILFLPKKQLALLRHFFLQKKNHLPHVHGPLNGPPKKLMFAVLLLWEVTPENAGGGVGVSFSAGKRCLSEASCFSQRKRYPHPGASHESSQPPK
jgi:hypothetical protein